MNMTPKYQALGNLAEQLSATLVSMADEPGTPDATGEVLRHQSKNLHRAASAIQNLSLHGSDTAAVEQLEAEVHRLQGVGRHVQPDIVDSPRSEQVRRLLEEIVAGAFEIIRYPARP